jgi:hypothetical protein
MEIYKFFYFSLDYFFDLMLYVVLADGSGSPNPGTDIVSISAYVGCSVIAGPVFP